MSAGKVVIVTGCSDGGIGAALCEAFVARGCVVYATARRLESMSELRSRAAVRPLQLDVTDEASVRRAVETVAQETGGRIDVLVNNAGVGMAAPLAEVDLNEARMTYDTNVWGLLAMVQAVFPHMAARRSGTVVNVSSIAGYVAVPWCGIYSSTKAAVHSLTDVLRLELAPFGIKTVLIAPGAIKSRIIDHANNRLDVGRFKLYAPLLAGLYKSVLIVHNPHCTDTLAFATQTVAQILKANPPRHDMRGNQTGNMRLIMWMPLWMRDFLLATVYQLNRALGPATPPLPPPAAADAGVAARVSVPPLAGSDSSGGAVKKGQ